jgi:HEAT repeat protein
MEGEDNGKADESLPGQNNESPDDRKESKDGETDQSQDNRLAHFISMLSDDDEVSRWRAAEALGRMEDPAAVDELISTLWDDDARVRLKAAWALGRIGDRRAYAPLQRLYRMENEDTREVITDALENIRSTMSRQ